MENIYQDNGHLEPYPDIEAMLPILKNYQTLSLDWQQMDMHFVEAPHPTIAERFYRVETQQEDVGFSFGVLCFERIKKEGESSEYKMNTVELSGGFEFFCEAIHWCEKHANDSRIAQLKYALSSLIPYAELYIKEKHGSNTDSTEKPVQALESAKAVHKANQDKKMTIAQAESEMERLDKELKRLYEELEEDPYNHRYNELITYQYRLQRYISALIAWKTAIPPGPSPLGPVHEISDLTSSDVSYANEILSS